MPVCSKCGNDPCDWDLYGNQLLMIGNQRIREGKRPPSARYACYEAYTHLIHGQLGTGNRRELPWCVEGAIKATYPSSSYTGYRPGEDDGIDVRIMTDFSSKVSLNLCAGDKEGQREFFGKRDDMFAML